MTGSAADVAACGSVCGETWGPGGGGASSHTANAALGFLKVKTTSPEGSITWLCIVARDTASFLMQRRTICGETATTKATKLVMRFVVLRGRKEKQEEGNLVGDVGGCPTSHNSIPAEERTKDEIRESAGQQKTDVVGASGCHPSRRKYFT